MEERVYYIKDLSSYTMVLHIQYQGVVVTSMSYVRVACISSQQQLYFFREGRSTGVIQFSEICTNVGEISSSGIIDVSLRRTNGDGTFRDFRDLSYSEC